MIARPFYFLRQSRWWRIFKYMPLLSKYLIKFGMERPYKLEIMNFAEFFIPFIFSKIQIIKFCILRVKEFIFSHCRWKCIFTYLSAFCLHKFQSIYRRWVYFSRIPFYHWTLNWISAPCCLRAVLTMYLRNPLLYYNSYILCLSYYLYSLLEQWKSICIFRSHKTGIFSNHRLRIRLHTKVSL